MSWLGRILFGGGRPRERDELPENTAVTSRGEAIAIAEGEASARQLGWPAPVDARLTLLSGRARWVVHANAKPGLRGYSVRVVIDDATRAVVDVIVNLR